MLYLSLLPSLGGKRTFSNFYDLQARALLDGRIDVPPGSLGIEAFIDGGRHYLYFPPGPALLRVPLLAVTDRFDGRLTAVSMLLAWTLTVTLVCLLLWRIRRMVRGDAPLGRAEAFGCASMVAASTAGTVVLFLGSIPWVYHEAYAWAIASSLGFAYCLLGVVERPTLWGVVGTGAFTTAAVLSRTTAGWACAVAVLLAAVFLPGRRGAADRNLWWQLWLAAALPVLAGIAVNWAKFRHPFLFPIDQQVFTSVSAQRRAAIEANGGDLFDPSLLWSTLVNYLRPNGIRFVSVYPYITLPPHIARSFGGGFLDQSNRTGSIVSFTPLLFGLSVWGVLATLRRNAHETLRPLRIPLLGLGGIPLGILFYAYIAHRYTSEFTPLLIVAGAIGFVELARGLERRQPRTRGIAFGLVGVLALFSVAASFAAGVNNRALASPGQAPIVDYVARQAQLSRLTGNPIDGYVTVSDELPPTGGADDVHIVGSCDSYFLGSGDEFRPWAEIGVRDQFVDVVPRSKRGSGEAVLGRIEGHRSSELVLEQRADGQFRIQLRGGGFSGTIDWFRSTEPFSVIVVSDGELDYQVAVFGRDDLGAFRLGRGIFDAAFLYRPNVYRPVSSGELASSTVSAELTPRGGDPLDECEDLLGG